MVVPGISHEEMAFAIQAVAGDESLGFAEPRGGKTVGDEADCSGGQGHFFGGEWKVEVGRSKKREVRACGGMDGWMTAVV